MSGRSAERLRLQLQPRRDPLAIVRHAINEHKPTRVFSCFSGGNDSTVLTHWAWRTGLIDAALHINTGVGIQQTREFVRSFCRNEGIPLVERCAPDGTYERLVEKFGFPGPGFHFLPYIELKQDQIDALAREIGGPMLLITGVRVSESQRRMGNVNTPIEVSKRDRRQIWVAPILDWTRDDLHAYRAAHNVPENEVAALLHMSGECLCGAFAKPGELEFIEQFYPADVAPIRALERKMAERGELRCKWGVKRDRPDKREVGPLCVGCELDLLATEAM